jgi:hypothetical protein
MTFGEIMGGVPEQPRQFFVFARGGFEALVHLL